MANNNQPPKPPLVPRSEFDRQRAALLRMVADNDDRLWYITRHKVPDPTFPDEDRETLLAMRTKVRDQNYLPDLAEENKYYKATNAAACFIGERRPETISVFAKVQRGEEWTPLWMVYWLLAIFLVFALLSQGYQAALTRQIDIMNTQEENYITEARKLTTYGQDISQPLAEMCQQTLRYRTATEQLQWWVPWVSSESPGETDQQADKDRRRPGMCRILAQAVTDNVPLDKPPLPDSPFEERVKILAKYTEQIADVRRQARTVHLLQDSSRKLKDSAETAVTLLNLLLLPCLFAALGALTSATRSADARFKAMTLSRVDRVGLVSRVLLGVVAGATVGIVFNSSLSLSEQSGLTELGLAFAFGYAVDIFFNLLDGVKTGAGGSNNAPPPT